MKNGFSEPLGRLEMEVTKFSNILWLLLIGCSFEELINQDECGTTTVLGNINNRIIGPGDEYGTERVRLGEFPWLALVLITVNTTHNLCMNCGGSLISERFILTAAHCFIIKIDGVFSGYYYSEDRINAYMGFSNTYDGCNRDPVTDEELMELVTSGVAKLIRHQGYNPYENVTKHDVALLILKNKINFTDYVRPICLPDKDIYPPVDAYPNDNAIITGWGCIALNTSSVNDSRKATVQIHPLPTCGIYDSEWSDHQICAGEYNKTDACLGDSGGPMMKTFYHKKRTRYFHVGVITAGLRDNDSGVIIYYPGRYARTAYYIPWIKDEIARYDLEQGEEPETCSSTD